MIDPPRLIGSADDFERSLLGAWDTRQPDESARARTLAVLGVVAVGAGATTALGSLGSIAPKAMMSTAAIIKWMGLGAGLAATAGLVGYAAYTRLTPSPSGATELTLPAPSVALVPRPVAPVVTPRDPADDLSVETVPVAPTRAAARPSPTAASASSLEDEVYAIDQARRALTTGDPAAALQLVDAFDARYPSGALAQESAEVRIEALYRTGKRAQADKLASRFLAAHPQSPYAREIRALMTATP